MTYGVDKYSLVLRGNQCQPKASPCCRRTVRILPLHQVRSRKIQWRHCRWPTSSWLDLEDRELLPSSTGCWCRSCRRKHRSGLTPTVILLIHVDHTNQNAGILLFCTHLVHVFVCSFDTNNACASYLPEFSERILFCKGKASFLWIRINTYEY